MRRCAGTPPHCFAHEPPPFAEEIELAKGIVARGVRQHLAEWGSSHD
jgi:hypothetical protein